MRAGVGVMRKINVNETAFSLVVVGVITKGCVPVVPPAEFEAAPDGREIFSVLTPEKSAASQLACRGCVESG